MSQSPQDLQNQQGGVYDFPQMGGGMSPWNFLNPSITSPYLWGQFVTKPNNINNAYSPNAAIQAAGFYGNNQFNPMGGWGMQNGVMSPFGGGGVPGQMTGMGGGFNPYGIPFAGFGGNLGGAPPGAYGMQKPPQSTPQIAYVQGGASQQPYLAQQALMGGGGGGGGALGGYGTATPMAGPAGMPPIYSLGGNQQLLAQQALASK